MPTAVNENIEIVWRSNNGLRKRDGTSRLELRRQGNNMTLTLV